MPIKVGLVQESPVFFNKVETISKIERLTKTYAAQGCDLLVFPESFIPGYPRGFTFGATIGSRSEKGRKLYAEYYENSLNTNSEDLKRLEYISKKYEIYLVIGVTEKDDISGSLYCSMLYISPNSGLMGTHRKIKPTGTERIVWAEASGESLTTYQTKIGRLGGLICWENYMPMARMSMYNKGVEIYIAPTADAREEWTSTMQHIALEGRCFVLGCNQYFTKSMYPKNYQSLVDDEPETMCRGGSIIVAPNGKIIAGPLYDKAGVLLAELDLEEIKLNKLDFDVIGHYARNDIFQLEVKDQPEIKKEKY
jgi:nitrilase